VRTGVTLESNELDAAWQAVYDAVRAGWTVVRPVYHGEERLWHVTALGPAPAKRGRQPMVEGLGPTEAKCLWDLARLLEEWVPEDRFAT
jgi:hypothetical protein